MDIKKGLEYINNEFPRCRQMHMGITGFEKSSIVQPIRDAFCNDFLNVAMTQQEKDWLDEHGLEARLEYARHSTKIIPEKIVFCFKADNPLRNEWLNTSWGYSFDCVAVKRRTPQKCFEKGRRNKLFCHYEFAAKRGASAGIPRASIMICLSQIKCAYEQYARWAVIKKCAKGMTIDKYDIKLLTEVSAAVAQNHFVFGIFRPKCGRATITSRKTQALLTSAWENYNRR